MAVLHQQIYRRGVMGATVNTTLCGRTERLAAYYGDNYPAVVDARAALPPGAGGTRHG